MAVPDTYQIKVRYSVRGEQCWNTLYLHEILPTSHANPCFACANAVRSNFVPVLRDCLSAYVQLDELYCRRITPGPAIPHQFIDPLIGNVAVEALPPIAAAVICLYPVAAYELRWASHRWSGCPENFNNAGRIAGDGVAKLGLLADEYNQDQVNPGPGGGTWRFGVWDASVRVVVPLDRAVLRYRYYSLRSRLNRPGID